MQKWGISSCKKHDEYKFETAYDENVREKGENPTLEDYNRWILEAKSRINSAESEEEETEVYLLGIKTDTGEVFWDPEKHQIVDEYSGDPKLIGQLEEFYYGDQYPTTLFHFKFRDKIILGKPDGVTDQCCYEFKSTRNKFLYEYVRPVAILQANIYAYFLKRPRIRVQFHIRETNEIKTIEEAANYAKVEAELTSFIELLSGKRKAIPPKQWKCRSCDFKDRCFYLLSQKNNN